MLTYFIFILSATEYRNWLLHYSVPVLKGVLPGHYFLHYTLLVTAIAILVSDRITPEQLKLADELLDNFCKLMPELYGEYVTLHGKTVNKVNARTRHACTLKQKMRVSTR